MERSDQHGDSFDLKIIKLLILGDQSVGKTSFLLRYTNDLFESTQISTLGVDFKQKNLTVDGEKYLIQIWDSAGQERFKNITRNYYRKASGIILAFDSTNIQSFNNVKGWIKDISSEIDIRIPIVLISTKCDLDTKVVNESEGNEIAKQMGMGFFETSSKLGLNVNEAFNYLIHVILKLDNEKLFGKSNGSMVNRKNSKKTGKCCGKN